MIQKNYASKTVEKLTSPIARDITESRISDADFRLIIVADSSPADW